jgi:ketosteroid isomerase-like protein
MGDEATEREVLAAERALQAAQRASDVAALDRLLHPALLAVGPDGRIADKASDLAAHRDGVFRIHAFDERDLQLLVLGDTAITFVVVDVRGAIGDADVSARMRYTRTWTRDGGTWRVLAAHIAPVPD